MLTLCELAGPEGEIWLVRETVSMLTQFQIGCSQNRFTMIRNTTSDSVDSLIHVSELRWLIPETEVNGFLWSQRNVGNSSAYSLWGRLKTRTNRGSHHATWMPRGERSARLRMLSRSQSTLLSLLFLAPSSRWRPIRYDASWRRKRRARLHCVLCTWLLRNRLSRFVALRHSFWEPCTVLLFIPEPTAGCAFVLRWSLQSVAF